VSSRTIYLTTPGFEGALLDELGDVVRQPEPAPGVVVVTDDVTPDPQDDPVFARQKLPAAVELRAPSVARMAEAAYDVVQSSIDALGALAGGFTLHVLAPAGAAADLGSRADLIGRELAARLRERRRRAWRHFVPPERASLSFGDVQLVVQLLLVERERAWLSLGPPHPLARGGFELSPWPGGVAPVADDRIPPSRAYRKLEEAFLWMADEPQPGEVCVDLGAAPGSWSYATLKRRAQVIAVDRAALATAIRAYPGLRTIEGNAFSFVPATVGLARADWLLSDVICEPARTLALIELWLDQGWCRKMVVTVKFKGSSGYGILGEFRAALLRAGATHLRIKHLHHNKNEVTVMAVAPADRPR
jgi:23S rRNA (cytidine2498-2'-O)-methyltransferase